MVSRQDGALQVSLILALGIVCGASLGVWGLMRHWREVAELQLRLDACVGKEAMELKRTQQRIERQNRVITTLRAGVVAGTVLGLTPEARAALDAAVAWQELERGRWQARRVLWLARGGCGRPGDVPLPLPDLGWRRPPPDPIGPRPLAREPGLSLRVRALHLPRSAAAKVEGGPNGWTAEWTRFGSGLD